jgi:hypothetical protein
MAKSSNLQPEACGLELTACDLRTADPQALTNLKFNLALTTNPKKGRSFPLWYYH